MNKRQKDNNNEEKRKKKIKRVGEEQLPSVIHNEDVKKGVKEAWLKRTQYSIGDLELDCHPFPHFVIRNFINNENFLENLQRELLNLNFHEKSNDLYKFKQSDDLKTRKEPHITCLRTTLFGPFRSWLEEVLELELESTVDISCAKYQCTDVLLCHDDELESRRVAFILYLVPPWLSGDGGALDLFSTDDNFQPQSIVKSLVPCWNTMVLFEVSPVSFHQGGFLSISHVEKVWVEGKLSPVSEVLSEDKCRLSLSGWFHGPSLARAPRYIEPSIPRNPHLPRDETLLLQWVNPLYLDVAYQGQVQGEFEDSSEIQLKNFLKEDKFKEVSKALRLGEIQWTKKGPPNKRSYEVALLEALPSCVAECWQVLHSEPFFLLLSNLTGLRLHFLCPCDEDSEEDEKTDKGATRSSEDASSAAAAVADDKKTKKVPSTPVCVGELRRWGHGNYSLLHDEDAAIAEYALDLLLPMGCADWQSEFGGFTSYIANEEDEELLTVYPEDNSLALVYRDKETLKFVKHINHRCSSGPAIDSSGRSFYDFCFAYFE